MSALTALRIPGIVRSVSTETVYLPDGTTETQAVVVSNVTTDPIHPSYSENDAKRLADAVGDWWQQNHAGYDRLVVKRTWEV